MEHTTQLNGYVYDMTSLDDAMSGVAHIMRHAVCHRETKDSNGFWTPCAAREGAMFVVPNYEKVFAGDALKYDPLRPEDHWYEAWLVVDDGAHGRNSGAMLMSLAEERIGSMTYMRVCFWGDTFHPEHLPATSMSPNDIALYLGHVLDAFGFDVNYSPMCDYYDEAGMVHEGATLMIHENIRRGLDPIQEWQEAMCVYGLNWKDVLEDE